jgi:Leucine-rich repeat (LRR) protein
MDKTNKSIQQLIVNVKENSLTKLDFRDTDEKFEELPDEVYELTNLEELNLGSNKVKNVSPKISKLNKLKVFNADERSSPKDSAELKVFVR